MLTFGNFIFSFLVIYKKNLGGDRGVQLVNQMQIDTVALTC